MKTNKEKLGNEWEAIISEAYENTELSDSSVTLELLNPIASWDFELTKETPINDEMTMTNKNLEHFRTITFKDTTSRDVFKIRKYKLANYPEAYAVYTTIDNILYDGQPIINKFNIAPEKLNSDKSLFINTDPKFRNGTQLYTTYKDFGKTKIRFRFGINLEATSILSKTIIMSPLFRFNSTVHYEELKKLLKL